jgi:CubicO group peptidase (beta-lactamase class C family)/nucleotide-binding universal stress UspA family protein
MELLEVMVVRRSKLGVSLLVVAAGACLAAPARAQVGELPEPLRRRIGSILEATGAAGAAVAVIRRDGVSFVGGVGRADPAAGRPIDAGTLFRVGSITKSFIALGVMRLVEQGRLSLEDRVADLAPELDIENRWQRTDPVRVAHLLEHTAGFDEMRFNEIFAADGREDRSLREVLAVNPRSRRTRWRPGTRFAYSQPGYTVAAYLIEKVSGLPYERFLDEQVFRPLGIAGAALRFEADARARLAIGHHRGQPRAYQAVLHRPAANLMISAAGLGRLLAMMLGRGELDGTRFLGPASIARIERSGTLPYGPAEIAYGLANWGDVSQPFPMRGHGGWMPGYTSIYRYSPAQGFGYAVLVNDSRSRAPGAISRVLMEHLLDGRRPPAPPKWQPPPGALARHVGWYRMAAPEIEFMRWQSDLYGGASVREEDGRLVVAWRGGPPVPLIPTGPGRFRLPRESGSSVEFVRGEDGRPALSIHGRYFEKESATWAAARRWGLELALFLLASTAIVPLLLLLAGPRRAELGLTLGPFVAGACLVGTWWAFDGAAEAGDLGHRNAATLAVWALSWAFALAAHLSFHRALAGLRSPPAAGRAPTSWPPPSPRVAWRCTWRPTGWWACAPGPGEGGGAAGRAPSWIRRVDHPRCHRLLAHGSARPAGGHRARPGRGRGNRGHARAHGAKRAGAPHPGPAHRDPKPEAVADAEVALAAQARLVREAGVECTAYSTFGAPADELVRRARDIGARYLALGRHGHRAVTEVLVGSVATRVVRHAPCVVLVTPPAEHRD